MVQLCSAADLSPYALFVAERVSLFLFSLFLGEHARYLIINHSKTPC